MRVEAYDLDVLTAGRLRLIVVTALVVLGGLAVDAFGAGAPATDGWDATLSYVSAKAPNFPFVSKPRLRVTHGGAVVYNRIVPLPSACVPGGCRLGFGAGGRAFQLVDLGPAKGPAAVIWLWTGGAHCCTVVRAVSLPDGALAAKDFGNAGARLARLGGKRVFVSADDRFAYLFTSYAESGAPIQVWRFRAGRFSDVTRLFPDQIAADASRWWTLTQRARRDHREARGVFSAWAADTCALGRKATFEKELATELAAGAFSALPGKADGPASQYATALRRKLAAWGYCR